MGNIYDAALRLRRAWESAEAECMTLRTALRHIRAEVERPGASLGRIQSLVVHALEDTHGIDVEDVGYGPRTLGYAHEMEQQRRLDALEKDSVKLADGVNQLAMAIEGLSQRRVEFAQPYANEIFAKARKVREDIASVIERFDT